MNNDSPTSGNHRDVDLEPRMIEVDTGLHGRSDDEAYTVVVPGSRETRDDKCVELVAETLGVVICERTSPEWVFAGLILITADPLQRLRQLCKVDRSKRREPKHPTADHRNNNLAIAETHRGSILSDEFVGDIGPITFIVEIKTLVSAIYSDTTHAEQVAEVHQEPDVVERDFVCRHRNQRGGVWSPDPKKAERLQPIGSGHLRLRCNL